MIPDVVYRLQSDKWIRAQAGRAENLSKATRHALARTLLSQRSLCPGDDVAVCIVGSLARSDLSRFSDIDLLILTPRATRAVHDLKQRLTCMSTTHPVSCQIWDDEVTVRLESRLSFWFAIRDILRIAGSDTIFERFLATHHRKLQRMPWEQLVDMYENERCHISSLLNAGSALSTNLKRGLGGMVDCQFGRLAHLWRVARDRPLCEREDRLRSTLYCFVCALKWHLQERFRKPVQDYAWLPRSRDRAAKGSWRTMNTFDHDSIHEILEFNHLFVRRLGRQEDRHYDRMD